jgi:glutamate/tyrosine decarboxylase-like PLP-dependent enzyme
MTNNILNNFIGPKAENIKYLKKLLDEVIDDHAAWRKSFYEDDPALIKTPAIYNRNLENELKKFMKRIHSNLPFHHPRYAAQMLKDPAIPTILGYLALMMSNPNNHAYEGGPVTTEMEMEVIDTLLKMTGYKKGWGHLASGGSLANMEALWAARDFYPEGSVFFSEVSHYSWKRICSILRIKNFEEIQVDARFRIDLNHLEKKLKKKRTMFVAANFGSTGTGSVDSITDLLYLKEKYGFHLHLDAAYGGFARSVILDKSFNIIPKKNVKEIDNYIYEQLKAIEKSDSLTIDPHKLGLISYGAGAVLYKNEKLKDMILNTAPYTYHKLDKPNIGMFSLEGSRPGAMAAACYLTYKVIPPHSGGLGKIIFSSISSSKKFYQLAATSPYLLNLNQPDLDINCFYVHTDESTVKAVNTNTELLYNHLSVETKNPEFILSKFVLPPSLVKRILPDYTNAQNANLSVMRIVFMKHWSSLRNFYYVRELIKTLNRLLQK